MSVHAPHRGFTATLVEPIKFWLRYILLIVKMYVREVYDLWHEAEPDWLYAQYVQEMHDHPSFLRRWYVERILMNVLIWRHFHPRR